MDSKEQITGVCNGLLIRAPAKINLSLLIAGKRPDGFHEIETVTTKVNWYDEIFIEPSEKAGIELICKGPHRELEEKGKPSSTGPDEIKLLSERQLKFFRKFRFLVLGMCAFD